MRVRTTTAVLLTTLVFAAPTLIGCTRAQANVVLEPPPLNVPLPPPRVIETVVMEPPPPPAETAGDAPADVTPPATPLPQVPAAAAKPDPPRPQEPPRNDVTTSPNEPVGPKLPAPLQAVPAQQEVRLEAEIRKLINSADSSLKRTDYRALGTDARSQYDIAKNFILEAEIQLKAKNLTFARSLASSAATLARELSSR